MAPDANGNDDRYLQYQQYQGPVDLKKAHSKTVRLDILPNVNPAASTFMRPRSAAASSPGGTQAITLSLEELRSLFQNAYDATVITSLSGEILQVNDRAVEFLSGPGEKIVGRNIRDLISGAESDLIEKIMGALATERFVRIHAWCRGGNGAYFPTEIAVYSSSTGDFASHLCFFIRDITWRKEAEDRLQMVDTAMHTARAGIAMVNNEGIVTYANPAMATLCGLRKSGDLQGREISDFFKDPTLMADIATCLNAGSNWSGQITLTKADGQQLVVEGEAAPTHDTDDDVTGSVISFTDISDTLRAQEAERTLERNRVMIESIGTVCHHLGQPSTVLLNCLELLNRLDDNDVEQRKELLTLSLSAAESLGELLRELNDVRTYRSETYVNNENIVALKPEGGSSTEEMAESGIIQ